MPSMSDEREIIDGLMNDAEEALVRGRLGKAQALYHGILRLAPDHAGALRQLAAIELNGGDPALALEFFEQARQIEPLDADLCHGIATALRLMRREGDAELALNAALKIDPRHGPSLYDSAMLLQKRGALQAASQRFLVVAAQGGGRFDAAFNRGVTLYRMGNLQAAERWFHVAAVINEQSPKPLINLGMIYRTWGFLKEAIACQERALSLDPENVEAHWNLANALLTTGDFARGFSEYEWRFKRSGRQGRPAEFLLGIPRWTGEALGGRTILITLEQGLGDALHFVRFAGDVANRGGRVVIEAPPALASLLATAPGVAEVVGPGANVPEASCYAPLMSLPYLLGITLESLQNRGAYLRVPAGIQAPGFSQPGLRVGLVWRGNPQHENDRNRSLNLDALTPLLDIEGVSFFSLQVGSAGKISGAWDGRMIDLAPKLKDFGYTAAVVQALDLVISVDTAVAHVAGALDKPVWILIAEGNDWRWLHGRDDSPWYPSARLFRQRRGRRWAPTINLLKQALQEMARKRGSI